MALDISFLHFTTKASYDAEKSRNETDGTLEEFESCISFIDEGPTICTRGKEYKCSVDQNLVEELINSAGHATVSQLADYLPLAGGTMTGTLNFVKDINNIITISTINGEKNLLNIVDSKVRVGQNTDNINGTVINVADAGLEVSRPYSDSNAIVYDTENLTSLSQLENDLNLDFIPNNKIGVANGVASLDSSGLVPSSQLPSFVDDVLEYDSFSDFPPTGESGKIYVAKDTNKTYR
jgi:hypothetical protein